MSRMFDFWKMEIHPWSQKKTTVFVVHWDGCTAPKTWDLRVPVQPGLFTTSLSCHISQQKLMCSDVSSFIIYFLYNSLCVWKNGPKNANAPRVLPGESQVVSLRPCRSAGWLSRSPPPASFAYPIQPDADDAPWRKILAGNLAGNP